MLARREAALPQAHMNRKRVGILGAGQLGRMLALAGYPLGIECRFLDREARSPGGQVAPIVLGALDDAAGLAALADGADVITFEIENVAVTALESVGARVPVFPPPAAVAAAQDRLREKELFHELGIPTAPFVSVASAADLGAAADALGWPIVLKTRRLGYDGRGQRIAKSAAELLAAWQALGQAPAIAERFVRFERELSLIGACNARDRVFYPLAENIHRDGILATTVAPFAAADLQQQAQTWLAAIMQKYRYRGVLTVEFFHTADGLVANEMAPRVHNSGHWTIEGAQTSQFENHLRGVLDWPLGDPSPRGHAAMVNLIGELPPREAVLALPGAHLHDYGKSPRPLRKLGHCTLVDDRPSRLLERLAALRAVVGV
jgi:5-(carboxyamino)imidazole ribonucleotide synthase